jgi:energy-converting hydrogenase Eha subunit F
MIIPINILENIIDSRAQLFYKKKLKKLLNINILIINFKIFSFIKIQIINFYLFFKF